MKAPRFLRRNADTPTLRERAAALKAKAATLIRKPAKDADPQRRAIMATGLAAAVAAPLPVLAAHSTVDAAHPDQAVFDARAAIEHWRVISSEATRTFDAAHNALWRDLGPYPDALLISRRDSACFAPPRAPREVWSRRLFEWITPEQGGSELCDQAWTARGLRLVIKHAVPMFGKGGQTPIRIRHWRSLIPIAEAFEARRATLEDAHHIDVLREASHDAAKRHTAAQATFHKLPATTPEGLAVIVRFLADGAEWWKGGYAYECLIRSAAAVSGVTLVGPDFDPARWVREWEAVGGSVKLIGGCEWGAMSPMRSPVSEAERDEVMRLRDGWGEYQHLITRHLDAISPV